MGPLENVLQKEGIAENLRFMVIEVVKQVENTRKVLETMDPKIIESVTARDDYIDNLKSVIENKCYSAINRSGPRNPRSVDILRASITVSTNLERIGDFAVNIVGQSEYLKDKDFIQRFDLPKFFDAVLTALNQVFTAMIRQDMSQAFKICRSEFTLDFLYKIQFDRILNELRSGKETENLITSHLILRYLERMGDSLLNIGEAIIFAALGEKFKIRQYEALRETLAKSGVEVPISEVEFHSIWGTRSGCRIGLVTDRSRSQKEDTGCDVEGGGERVEKASGVLFKEGNRKKLLQEMENINRWESILPGLPPKVLAHQEDGSQASMLIEYLSGCTFQDVVLTAEAEIIENALFLLEQTLLSVWEHTITMAPIEAGFIKQMESRLDDVLRLYPNFEWATKTIGSMEIVSFDDMLKQARDIENELESPYSVFIHGDFNINNIVYDHEAQRIHFIDLHRSKLADPLQDISVFVVSNYRLPIFDLYSRARLNRVAKRIYHFSKDFGVEHGDTTFDARLALGLARSFITSTRFELNMHFAKDMFLRGVYFLEKLLDHKGRPWDEFVLSEDALVY